VIQQKDDHMAQIAGDLTRLKSHDPDEEWPTLIEIVCYWGPKDAPRKGRRRAIEIDADQFFGHGRFGAPMSGDQLIGTVERLRKQGPKS
jgi:hypothetical protein